LLCVQLTPVEQACGDVDPSRVCVHVFEWTDNAAVAEFSEWVIDRPVRVFLILVLAWFANRGARRAIAALTDRIRTTPSHPRLRQLRLLGPGGSDMDQLESDRAPFRADAIESALKSLVSVVIWTIAVLLVLGEMNINLAPLIAGAGILGIAIGFGAQSVVGDFLAGAFMLIEDQYGVGDTIEVDGVVGEVESVSLRTTKLRDLGGTVWHIPNGEIKKVGNHSQLWSNAVVDVSVAYSSDLREAMRIMDQVAEQLWNETHTNDKSADIIEDPRVLGVQELGDSSITLRLVVKTVPSSQWQVQRELRLRLKEAFDAAGIEIPFPQRVVHTLGEAAASD
jgi:small conductance mechanosensitive channel